MLPNNWTWKSTVCVYLNGTHTQGEKQKRKGNGDQVERIEIKKLAKSLSSKRRKQRVGGLSEYSDGKSNGSVVLFVFSPESERIQLHAGPGLLILFQSNSLPVTPKPGLSQQQHTCAWNLLTQLVAACCSRLFGDKRQHRRKVHGWSLFAQLLHLNKTMGIKKEMSRWRQNSIEPATLLEFAKVRKRKKTNKKSHIMQWFNSPPDTRECSFFWTSIRSKTDSTAQQKRENCLEIRE